ncbi:hypothetical protein N7462_001454 [Penicillium macrosclerotiorum]|uniref:uncharacterized protein n=1 Tax=Penicillium macrosclerotiorum TaxID=303699 RepID=UPI002546C25D|nr:uncharacterized protein N7462_001454 [Penicillium macrosclerotiorum]KAJ5692031.1 hypothetical protein N7462_001454 [Penicillium macrosclerotiorum]
MAPSHSFLSFLSFAWIGVLLAPLVCAAPWIVTDEYQEVRVTNYPEYYNSEFYPATVTTSIEEIIPTVTSLPSALSTSTNVETYGYETVTIIEKLYPSGAVGTPVPKSAYNDYYYYYNTGHTTIFMVNLVFTAPTGCSTQFTRTSAVSVDPSQKTVERLLPKTSVSTSYSVYNTQPFQSATRTYVYVWVDPTQVPTETLYSLSDYSYPTSLYVGSDCQYEGHGYGSSYRYNDYYYDYGVTISPIAIIIICVLGWIVLMFLFGILEAWIRFRRLMTGWQTRRGLPVCWALTIMPFTLFCLCCFRKGFRARTAHDSAVLQQRWKNMSAWTKFKLFWVWGFRYKYPPILGPAPARVNPSKRPGKHPGPPMGPPLLYQTPPQTGAYPPVSPVVSLNRGPGPEMGQVQSQHQASPVVPEASGALASESQAQPQTLAPAPTQTPTQPQPQPQQAQGHHNDEVGRAQ